VGVISFELENEASIAPATEKTAEIPTENPAVDENTKTTDTPAEKKALTSSEAPKFSGIELSAMLEKDGGKLRDMIDTCQQLLGHIFRPVEVNVLISLCEWLGLEAEYVVTLAAYCVERKPGCKVSYIDTTARALWNDGIQTTEALNEHIKALEVYDGVAGKLRSLIGIGAREFTKKENGIIHRWIDLGYGFDVIKLAYEECCNATSKFSFSYADKVIDGWYKAGVKTVSDAKNEIAKFKDQKSGNTPLEKSFDPTEFFASALSRSYKNMKK
jgi:DnaD/phage-associated family protein